MNKNNFLIIMAGGIGSRFWPMSTSEKPKQFLDILGTGKTMIQQTVSRFGGVVPMENIYIVTSSIYKKIILEQIPEINENQVLLEPCMRNTAPCIAYPSYKIHKRNSKANIVVAPSDHLITNETEFRKIITQGLAFTTQNDVLLTLGIQPHRPETGYGYIQGKIDDFENGESRKHNNLDKDIIPVADFKEKPALETAKRYLEEGNYFWNSGIFLWSAKSIILAFEKCLPELANSFSDGILIYDTDKEQDYINTLYPNCENISIDYGIMERANNIYVLPCDFGWSDLGTWGSLWEKRQKNENGNSVVGTDVQLFDCEGTIVTVPDNRSMVLQGLHNYIVVEANGVVLICKKEDEQRIKEFREKVLEKKTKSNHNISAGSTISCPALVFKFLVA